MIGSQGNMDGAMKLSSNWMKSFGTYLDARTGTEITDRDERMLLDAPRAVQSYPRDSG